MPVAAISRWIFRVLLPVRRNSGAYFSPGTAILAIVLGLIIAIGSSLLGRSSASPSRCLIAGNFPLHNASHADATCSGGFTQLRAQELRPFTSEFADADDHRRFGRELQQHREISRTCDWRVRNATEQMTQGARQHR